MNNRIVSSFVFVALSLCSLSLTISAEDLREYKDADRYISFMYPAELLVASKGNGFTITDPRQENGDTLIINEFSKEYLAANKASSLTEYLSQQDEVIKAKQLNVDRHSIVIGPDKVPAVEYVRHDRQDRFRRDISNIFFEYQGRVFNFALMMDPRHKEQALVKAYDQLKRTFQVGKAP